MTTTRDNPVYDIENDGPVVLTVHVPTFSAKLDRVLRALADDVAYNDVNHSAMSKARRDILDALGVPS